jgi:hypothetical protein
MPARHHTTTNDNRISTLHSVRIDLSHAHSHHSLIILIAPLLQQQHTIIMSRGNQRDTDRAKAQVKNQAKLRQAAVRKVTEYY